MALSAAFGVLAALFALLRNPSSKIHRWLFLLIFSACLWVVSVNLHSVVGADIGLWLLRLAFVTACFLGYSILRFCQEVSGAGAHAASKIIFGLAAFIGMALSLSPWVIQGFSSIGDSFQPVRGPAYLAVIVAILSPIIYGVVLLDYRRRHRKGVQRMQLWIIEVGLVMGTFVGVLTNVLLPNITKTTDPSRFAFLAILILTCSLVYAVVQHRFLDIRLTLTRAVAYLTTLITTATLYVIAIYTIAQFILTNADQATRQAIDILVAILVAVSFHPLKTFFDRVTSKLFYRDAYDTKEVIDKIGDVLVEEVEIEALARGFTKILGRAIKASHFEITLLDPKDKMIRRVLMRLSESDADGIIKALIKSNRKLVVVDELGNNHELQQALISADIAVVTKLETSKELLGYLLVSYKSNGAAYTSQDVELIRIAGDELAVAMQNALRFEEISHFNEKLKQEIEEATAQLRDSNRKLKKLDEAKDEFISMASHQLRTPLTSVKGYISMVMDGDAGKLTGPQQKLLEEAFIAAQRMVYLIGDFLNVSRLQTGRFMLERKRTDIAQVVNDEVAQLTSTAARRQITVQYHHPVQFPIVSVDENKIRQVIMNFIDNAIFYSRPNTVVDVLLVNTGREIRFEVHDAGIGVPQADRHKVFTKFFRAENARRVRPDGTGIGLFMAKKVITAHGGSMIFETKEHKGSTFGFVLPLAALKHQPEQLNH
ncbi:MAG TPA: ATP-binding protein [Candidatus Saccharimonadales bacterium]|nr:ATP-binding protein [Candidatus Saccharimonadales bacterium]